MITTRLSIILALSLCIAIALCAEDASPSNAMKKDVVLDMNSNGKKIELKVGDEIQIELKAMGSAGYAWYFDQLDRDIFELTGEEKKVTAEETKDTVGTPVISVWKLKAVKAGKTIIRMSQYRIWEGKDKAVNRFEISVDVMP